ncbi:MAG: hypothetical protein ACLFV6_14865 [Spirulinaceae cyanobacterium]
MQENHLFMENLDLNEVNRSFDRHIALADAGLLHNSQSLDGLIIAQAVEDPDVIGQMQSAFNNFVETGQIWALIIGLAIGFGFRSLLPS